MKQLGPGHWDALRKEIADEVDLVVGRGAVRAVLIDQLTIQ